MLIEKLAEKHLAKILSFSCVESEEMVSALNAKQRRRVLKHSKEMDDFLRDEAFSEQELGPILHIF